MAEMIRVSVPEMQITVEKYQASKNKLEDSFNAMDQALKILDTCWRGAAYEAFMATWRVTNGKIKHAEAKMADAIDELNASMQLFTENEQEITRKVSELEVGHSPF